MSKRCPRCGREYPDSYRSCPYCSSRGRRSQPTGLPEQIVDFIQRYGERIFLVSSVVFIAIALVGVLLTKCSAGEVKPEQEDPKPVETDTQPEEPEEPEEPLAMSQPAAALLVGETVTLSVTGADSAPVWSSSDEAIATVTDGTVTAKSAGSVTITAVCGLKKVFCTVTVAIPEPTVELYLNRKDFTIRPSDAPTFQMKVKVKETRKDYDGIVVWASADTSVVTISETGLVTKVGKGNTVVTATMGSKVLECIVRVS